MKILKAKISKGPDDYGIWIENFDGIFSAGESKEEATENLKHAIELYCEFNADAPNWLRNNEFIIQTEMAE
jgi:predicted RNase H-like HicB family nuclease